MVALPNLTDTVAVDLPAADPKPVGEVMGDVLQRYGLQLPEGTSRATSPPVAQFPGFSQLSSLTETLSR